jgi:conjugative transfer region protein (TIGR03750 family)
MDSMVTFLPHRLNRQPVVVRGLTANELWICAGLSGALGFALGCALAWMTLSVALIPTLIVAGIALGIFAGGGFLRRQKRGRPET